MLRISSLFIVLLLLVSAPAVFAQDEPDTPPVESPWFDYIADPHARGDRNFTITLGTLLPIFFSGIEDNQHGLRLGGTGTLAFNYFLSSNVFIGGELSGMFCATRRGNMLYIIPFGARIGYQFWLGRFDFPVSLMIGAASHRYLETGYFGLAIKPSASVFWRFNPDWSFGFNAVGWILPQRPRNGYNVIGNFLELTLSARYHF